MSAEEKRVVYWFTCDCDVRSKYCDEYHRACARVPLRVLESYETNSRQDFRSSGDPS